MHHEKKQPTQFDYSTLVSYMLPKGILDSFEINRIEEEDLGIKDGRAQRFVFFTSILMNETYVTKYGMI